MTRQLLASAALAVVLPAGVAAQNARSAPAGTEQRLAEAEGEIQALWQSYFSVVRDDLPNTKGSLDCGTGRYQELKPTNSYLVFFVACERLEAVSNGYRVAIAIGNPHTFGFGRVTGTLSYGENLAAALVRAGQRIAFSSPGELRPGAWTRIQVPIEGGQAKDLAKILVEFEAGAALARTPEPSGRSIGVPRYGLLQHP